MTPDDDREGPKWLPVRILLVEDDTNYARQLEDHLVDVTPVADQVDHVSTLAKALDQLQNGASRPDAVLLDLILPDASGLEPVRAIVKAAPDLPVVALTPSDDRDIALAALRERCEDCLPKDEAGPDHLARSVQYALERKRTKRELEEARRKLDLLDEHLQEVFYLWDFSTEPPTLAYCTSAYEEIWGRPVEEVIRDPLSFLEGIHPEDREQVRENLDAKLRGERHLDYRVSRPDGELRWIRDRSYPIRGEDGEIRWVAGSAVDITDQKELESDLERERIQLEEVFREAPAFLAVLRGPDHVFERVNPTYRKLVDDRELIGKSVREALPELENQPFFDILDEVYRTGEPYHARAEPIELDTGSGRERRRLSFTYQPLTKDGEVSGILVHGVDVTKQHELEEELRTQTERYEQILTEISDIVTILDEDGTIAYQSPSIGKLLGYEPEELMGRPVFELVHPDDLEKAAEAFFEAVGEEGRAERTVQYRIRHADGSWRQVETTGVMTEDRAIGPLAVTRDITDRVAAQQRYESIFDISPVALKLARFETGEYLEVNQTFQEIFGYSRSEVLGGSLSEDELWETPRRRERIYADLRDGQTVRNEEVRLRRKDGTMVDGMFSASLLERAGEELMIVAIQDISALKNVERELEHRALHDSLTGLANRALLTDRVEQGIARARRHGLSLGLLMLDLDQFKRINDRLGHAAGDRVLVEIARRLESTLREGDTVARWGGDEFFVVLPEFEAADSMAEIKSRIHGALRPPIKVAGESVHLDVSIGAVVYGGEGHETAVQTENPEELIRFASLALHWAKEAGRAGFELFNPDAEVEGADLLRRERALREALEEGQIIPHYQPIIRLEDKKIVGVEALARWQHPERGPVPPAEFIPLAEELGLIGELGEAIVRQGCQQMAELKQETSRGADLSIAFNFSAQQFRNATLVEELEESVVESGLAPGDVTLEVTETALMEVPAKVEALRTAGFQVSVDDFGTGYSTFTYLREFDFDELKIDMTFVQGITGSPSDVALVETMLTLGQRLGLRVVAEGIETEAQLRKLQGLGCTYGQGYLFARPGPLDELEGHLAS